MLILLLLMIACEGQLSSGDGGVSSDTSPGHQSMMDEINKLHEDVAELNEELGKKIYLRKSAEYFLQTPKLTVIPTFLDTTLFNFPVFVRDETQCTCDYI